MPRFIKLTLPVLVLVVLAAGGRAYLARESAQPGSAQRESGAGPAPAAAATAPMPVISAPVRVGVARAMVDAVGSLLADEAVVLSPEIDGRIQSLAFTEGQAVTRGQILVTLDTAEYEADVAQKEATVDLCQLKFSRARDHMGRKVMSKQDYDEAEASLKVAKAALALARARLAKTTLRAPFAGILGIRRVSPGDYVASGKALVNLEAIDPIKVGPPSALTPRRREEVSRITLSFTLERDPDAAAADVRDRVSRTRGALPREADEPVISKVEAEAQAWLAFASDRYSALEITDYVERYYVKDRLQSRRGGEHQHRFVPSGPLPRTYYDRSAPFRLSFNRCFHNPSTFVSSSLFSCFSGYKLSSIRASSSVLASLTASSHRTINHHCINSRMAISPSPTGSFRWASRSASRACGFGPLWNA
jgi:multidrug efflux pump subunit AcrA (membrane-fusion protein)